MNLDWPYPNVLCRCGVVLWSWKDVEKHWKEHREYQRLLEEDQRIANEVMRAAH